MATRARSAAGDDEFGDEFDGDYDPMAGFTAAQKRRVMALKEVQSKYDEINVEYQKELATLQSKYETKYAPLYGERSEIVHGKKAVGKFDVEDDGEPDSAIPEFWLTAFSNHDKVAPYLTERDQEVLAYLDDVKSEVLTGEDRGFKLTFCFRENPFFGSKELTKTYVLQPEDEIVPKQFIGCKIDWKEGKDVTVEEVKKRVKGKKGEKGAKAFVTEQVPCDSFFNTFDPPEIPEDPNALADDQMDELQEELTIDFDIGYAIKDNIIPRAVEWFTGEIAPFPEDYDDEEEFADDDVDMPAGRR